METQKDLIIIKNIDEYKVIYILKYKAKMIEFNGNYQSNFQISNQSKK